MTAAVGKGHGVQYEHQHMREWSIRLAAFGSSIEIICSHTAQSPQIALTGLALSLQHSRPRSTVSIARHHNSRDNAMLYHKQTWTTTWFDSTDMHNQEVEWQGVLAMTHPAQNHCEWLRASALQLCISAAAAMTGLRYCHCTTTTATGSSASQYTSAPKDTLSANHTAAQQKCRCNARRIGVLCWCVLQCHQLWCMVHVSSIYSPVCCRDSK
jgi:hypothetical protein